MDDMPQFSQIYMWRLQTNKENHHEISCALYRNYIGVQIGYVVDFSEQLFVLWLLIFCFVLLRWCIHILVYIYIDAIFIRTVATTIPDAAMEGRCSE